MYRNQSVWMEIIKYVSFFLQSNAQVNRTMELYMRVEYLFL